MGTKITATELARNLSDVLSRVEYRHEEFVVERSGQAVAVIAPTRSIRGVTAREIIDKIGHLKMPRGFGDDLAKIHAEQSRIQTTTLGRLVDSSVLIHLERRRQALETLSDSTQMKKISRSPASRHLSCSRRAPLHERAPWQAGEFRGAGPGSNPGSAVGPACGTGSRTPRQRDDVCRHGRW